MTELASIPLSSARHFPQLGLQHRIHSNGVAGSYGAPKDDDTPPLTEDDEDVLRFPLTLDLPDRAMRDSYASLQCSRRTQTRR